MSESTFMEDLIKRKVKNETGYHIKKTTTLNSIPIFAAPSGDYEAATKTLLF